MAKPTILVTGANGQLGKELRRLEAAYAAFAFLFLSREDLPLHHFELIRHFFEATKPAYCINCAAYTAVDRAETEKDMAFLVNGEAVGVLAAICHEFNTRLVHISTDYVFNGESPVPYKEADAVDPVNTYGAAKLKGEQLCREQDPDAIIIRTSWVYSEFGSNFVRTMIRLMKDRSSLNVVNDQVGSPTYGADLAKAIMDIIQGGHWVPGLYHYSNAGKISWYDFAVAIQELTGSACKIYPIPSSEFPTAAKRPSFSLLDTHKIRSVFGLTIPEWKDSLRVCIDRLQA